MRSWLGVWLISMLIWGTTFAQYDSCHIDDYHSVLIGGSMATNNYFYLNLPGVCPNRGDVSLRLIRIFQTNEDGDLFVDFQNESKKPIRNRFNVTPSCVAFSVGNVREMSVLMKADEGAPLLTIGPATIELSIGGSSVSFDASEIDHNAQVQRLQICMNGTDAVFYLDCKEVETKPFTVNNAGINFLSILGERNTTTLEYNNNFFDGAIQQLYSVQCADEAVDLRVLSILQCRSIPASDDVEGGTGCSQKVQSNLTQALNDVISELPSPPEDVKAFCDVIVWHNVPKISPMSISGYDVKLYNPDTGREVIRRTKGYEPFYILTDEDECFRQEMTMVEIRMNLTITSELFDPFSSFSSPINLGCEPPSTPSVYLELKGSKISDKSSVSIHDIGEGKDALLCRTNKAGCCAAIGSRAGEFYYPSRGTVRINKHGDELYRDRGEGVVRLNRRYLEGAAPPESGLYCCHLPDACNDVQIACVNLV